MNSSNIDGLKQKDNPFFAGLNPFHVPFHATIELFHACFPRSTKTISQNIAKLTLIPRKTHATSSQNPSKKARDLRNSTFVSVKDINASLTELYVKVNSETRKVWICLFTCLVTRAVHLELMQDMTTEQFLLGLRRFVAHHRSPRSIISGNASQFKLAADTIDKIWGQILTEPDVISYSVTERIRW